MEKQNGSIETRYRNENAISRQRTGFPVFSCRLSILRHRRLRWSPTRIARRCILQAWLRQQALLRLHYRLSTRRSPARLKVMTAAIVSVCPGGTAIQRASLLSGLHVSETKVEHRIGHRTCLGQTPLLDAVFLRRLKESRKYNGLPF
jgi:hypothetical protein